MVFGSGDQVVRARPAAADPLNGEASQQSSIVLEASNGSARSLLDGISVNRVFYCLIFPFFLCFAGRGEGERMRVGGEQRHLHRLSIGSRWEREAAEGKRGGNGEDRGQQMKGRR